MEAVEPNKAEPSDNLQVIPEPSGNPPEPCGNPQTELTGAYPNRADDEDPNRTGVGNTSQSILDVQGVQR